jgi:transposase-like protein
MARKIELPNLGDLRRAYEAGESVESIARRVGVSSNVVQRRFRAAGVQLRTSREVYQRRRGFRDSDVRPLHAEYLRGASSVDLAKRLGCHSSTLRNVFKRAGLPVRDARAAHIVHNAALPASERSRRAAAAHEAVRGVKHSAEQLRARALRREAAPPPMPSTERRVAGVLRRMGNALRYQRACGPYNIDLAIGDAIAVEVFGGGWHASGRHAARYPKRTRYLLDRGFDVVIVWVEQAYRDGWIHALHHVIADLQRADRDPAAPRQYRVIRRRGEVLSGDANDHDFPLVPPSEVGRDARGRYTRTA